MTQNTSYLKSSRPSDIEIKVVETLRMLQFVSYIEMSIGYMNPFFNP